MGQPHHIHHHTGGSRQKSGRELAHAKLQTYQYYIVSLFVHQLSIYVCYKKNNLLLKWILTQHSDLITKMSTTPVRFWGRVWTYGNLYVYSIPRHLNEHVRGLVRESPTNSCTVPPDSIFVEEHGYEAPMTLHMCVCACVCVFMCMCDLAQLFANSAFP